MKKLFVMICLLTITCISVNAQAPQDRPGGGRMNEAMKQRLKDEMKLSAVQVDSVMAIQGDMQMKSRQIRMDETMNDDQKKAKMEVVTAERKARLKGSLSDEQIAKLDAFYEEMRKMRQSRGNN